jgi:hypothetical protein
MPPPTKRTITIIALIAALTIFAFELRWLYARIGADNLLPDFIEYWAAGRAILSGQNPYSPDQLFSLQSSVGWTKADPLMMYNPPWAIPFILPFSFHPYPLGKFLWFLCHMALVFLCADWAWRLNGGSEKHRYLSLFIAFTFAPVLFAIGVGQIVPFILLGVIAFLQCEKLQKGWLTGLLLVPLAIKPHILYLFWIAFALWIFTQKKWPVVLALAAGILTATAVPLILYPDVISRYIFFILHDTPLFYISPSPGSFLRFLLGEEKLWMQALPPCIGLSWLFLYWKKNRKNWRWEQRMPAVIFASLLTAPYGWSFDYALLLPAVMKVAIEAFRIQRRNAVTVLIAAYLTINGTALSLRLMAIPDHYMFWFGPVLLAGYFLWSRITSAGRPSTSPSL